MKKNDIIIIPDVHGRTFWKEAVRDLTDRSVIFLGDYLDPYQPSVFDFDPSVGRISPEAVIQNFREIIQLKKEAPDKVTLLLGNHDCEYLYGKSVCDVRCDHKNYELIQGIFRENKDLFQMAAESRRGGKHFVFTHAGISIGWMDRHVEGWTLESMVDRLNQMNAKALGAAFPEETSFARALSEADRWRGGDSEYASPIWIDAEALNDGYQIRDIIQVVGHTAVWFADEPVIGRNVIYADCRKALVLGPRGGLRYMDGKRCVNSEPDPFHPRPSRHEAGRPFDLDWFQRPFCRECGSHDVFIRAGMYVDHWYCQQCHQDALM